MLPRPRARVQQLLVDGYSVIEIHRAYNSIVVRDHEGPIVRSVTPISELSLLCAALKQMPIYQYIKLLQIRLPFMAALNEAVTSLVTVRGRTARGMRTLCLLNAALRGRYENRRMSFLESALERFVYPEPRKRRVFPAERIALGRIQTLFSLPKGTRHAKDVCEKIAFRAIQREARRNNMPCAAPFYNHVQYGQTNHRAIDETRHSLLAESLADGSIVIHVCGPILNAVVSVYDAKKPHRKDHSMSRSHT